MSPGHLLRIVVIVGLVMLLLGRRRARRGPVPMLPAPGGSQQLGSFRTLSTLAPVAPVNIAEAPSPYDFAFSGQNPDWNTAPAPDWNSVQSSGRSPTLLPAQADELNKLDSLRTSGTLTEAAYLEARARLLGIAAPTGWSVILLNAGPNKIHAIKALRECRRDLGLRAAKDLVDHTPQTLFRGLLRTDAEQVTTYLQQAGVPAQLGPDA